MNKRQFCIDRKYGMRVLATVLIAGPFLALNPMDARGQTSGPPDGMFMPATKPPINIQQELQMKIKGPFTVVIAGDLNYRHPVSQLADPSVQAAIKIVRGGDVALANLEAGNHGDG